MVFSKVLLFSLLWETVVTSSEQVFDGYERHQAREKESTHGSSVKETAQHFVEDAQRYVHDAQAGLSHMLDELKAFQKRIEHAVLHTEKGAFFVAGVLCSIAMVVLVAGALYFHWFGNYVPKYVRVLKKNGKEEIHEEIKTETNGRLKSD